MPFTPVQTFLGGLLLHFSTSSLLEDTGRVFGISGIFNGAIFGTREPWQWATISGLLAGPLIGLATGLQAYYPGNGLETIEQMGFVRLALAGALVGFGSRLGSGCTSGHMLCGVSRLSPRSIVATATFFTTAVLTAKLLPLNTSPSVVPAYTLQTPPTQTMFILTSVLIGFKIAYSSLRRYLLASPSTTLRLAPFFLLGTGFSLGLSISGMTDPSKVSGFLQLFNPKHFDPSLGMIMLSGVLPNAIHYARIKYTARANFPWESWHVPTRKDVDWRLLIGSAIFGVGWALQGLCPGPAIVSLGEVLVRTVIPGHSVPMEALTKVITFVGAMVVSMGVVSLV
ncbi:hypothetical protein I203_106689 [Kwoniella mangroviensis CBS 8507]|uniref:uncharacterized protein n=1 Tax=Kwoniella mangroviensis CBS 8507 TaxID=1296122 RepID=UPI00080D39EE|nr:uncharacterized protein I203_07777 [Kwoniella mangroviensis CBS 8507]OCF63043.1 hypothetical protein I203_07777 [Kwoniella mangroviensis CBS 8507]